MSALGIGGEPGGYCKIAKPVKAELCNSGRDCTSKTDAAPGPSHRSLRNSATASRSPSTKTLTDPEISLQTHPQSPSWAARDCAQAR